jgi:hypothetical protein
MSYGASFRIAPGIRVYRSGGGAVFMTFSLAAIYFTLWVYALLFLAAARAQRSWATT